MTRKGNLMVRDDVLEAEFILAAADEYRVPFRVTEAGRIDPAMILLAETVTA